MKMLYAALVCLLAADVACAQDWRQLEREKRYDEALAAIEALAEKDPNRQALLMRSAMDLALRRLKNPELADKYVDMTKDPAWRGFLRFYLYQATGKSDEALQSLEGRGVEAFPVPARSEAYALLGNIHRARQETDQALDAYLNVVNSPGGAIGSYSWACKYAADIYLAKGEPEQAMALYQKCLKNRVFLAPRNMCLFDCVRLLAQQGKIEQALELLESEKSMFETKGYWKPVFYIEYARTLNLAGRKVQAIDMYGIAEKGGGTEAVRKQIEEERSVLLQQMISEL